MFYDFVGMAQTAVRRRKTMTFDICTVLLIIMIPVSVLLAWSMNKRR